MINAPAERNSGSHDGLGSADHDAPYRFGRRPRLCAPYPCSTREYARFLVLRGRVKDSPDPRDKSAAPQARRHSGGCP